jgi:hypothetical protein
VKIGLALRAEIESTFEIVRQRCTTTEICFVCPEPGCGDKSGNRSVNLQNGKTSCWRCNKGGNFLGWARRLGYRFNNATDVTQEAVDQLEQLQQKSLLPTVQPIRLPKGFTPISEAPDTIRSRYIGEMAVRKNLDFDALAEVGVGFTREDPKWEPYAIFPVTEYNVIAYYQGRTYYDKPGESTKLFPSQHEVKYGARYWVYNIDEARAQKAQIVIAVESILNVLSLRRKLAQLQWDNVVPVCVFKHRISIEQAIKLSRLTHVEEVCLMFDHDATVRAWESGRQVTNLFALTVAEMPMGKDNKKLDPNDDVEAAIKAFNKRQTYTPVAAAEKSLEAMFTQSTLAGRRIAVLPRV